MSRLSVLHALCGDSSSVKELLNDQTLIPNLAQPGFQNIAAEMQALLQIATVRERRSVVATAVESIFSSLSHYRPSKDEWCAIQIALPYLGQLLLSQDNDLRSAAVEAIYKVATASDDSSVLTDLPTEDFHKAITLSKVNRHQVGVITEIALLADRHSRKHGADCEIVLKCLKHSDPQYRLAATQKCSIAAQSSTCPYLPWPIAKALLVASGDSVASTRLAAIQAFTGWKRYQLSSVPRAAVMLEDEDPQVRIAAFNVLKGMSFACRASKAIRDAIRHHPELAREAK